MTDTGPPLNLPQLPRGATLWDDEVNGALDTINTEIATLLTNLAAKADLVSGVVPSGQLPTLNAIGVTPVANQAARVALSSAVVGTAVLQIDNGTIYVLTTLPYSTNGNWSAVNPGAAVTSWNAQTGTITGKPEYSTTGTWALKQTFTVSPSIPTGSVSDAPVRKDQLDTAIAGVSTSTIPGRYAVTLGNGSLKTFTQTHGRGTADVAWFVYDVSGAAPYPAVFPETVNVSSTQITLTFSVAPTSNQIRLVVI